MRTLLVPALRLLLAASAAIFLPSLRALGPVPPAANAADLAWETVKNFAQPTIAPAVGAGASKLSRAEQAGQQINQADQLRAFYTQYPDHASAADAKRLEALALNYGALAGDTTQDARRTQLIAAVRADATIPAERRFEVVAWSNQVALARQRLTTRTAVLGAHETVAKSLVAEFPSLDVAYESWLAVARDSAPVDAERICAEIAASTAPARFKSGAQIVSSRARLIGRPLSEVLGASQAAALLTSSDGKAVVVYSWSDAAPNAVSAILRNAPKLAAVSLVGICLDTDTAAGRAAAARAHLPGTQYFNGGGATSPLAQALLFTEPGMTYITDRQGIIRDVHGRSDLVAKLARYAK